MTQDFVNVYADERRARAYADLEFPNTYYLAFRDLPSILSRHVRGRRALDFGCGAGRSTRFLRKLGFEVVGVDVSGEMVRRARERDPEGDYRVIPGDGRFPGLEPGSVDLVFCAFTFDNIPGRERRVELFRAMGGLLEERGCLVNLVSSSEIYVHEWASFTTEEFPENRTAEEGGRVRIVMLDVADRRPVEDVFWTDEGYRSLYADAGLRCIETHRPLGRESEPYPWVSETRVSPWAIYVLRRDSPGRDR